LLELGNDVQADVGEFILEHLKEHRKEMGNSPGTVSIVCSVQSDDLLFLAQDRCEPADLSTKGSSDMLRGIGNQVLHTSHDLIEKGVTVNQMAEACQTLDMISQGENVFLPGIWPAMAVRTSASVSLRSLTKAGTISRVTTSS
jgi:hypothetical protein